jgi:hypothetical protein
VTVTLHTNPELVAVAWLSGVAGLSTSMVATTLPADNSTWAASGFVTVTISGGTPGIYDRLRLPAVTVTTWAVNPNSSKPPWGKAANLAEHIVAATQDRGAGRVVALPAGFPAAAVHSVWPLSEPRRTYGDMGDYAAYVVDIAFGYTSLEAA